MFYELLLSFFYLYIEIQILIFLYNNMIIYFKFMINKKRNFIEIYFLFTNHIKLILNFFNVL